MDPRSSALVFSCVLACGSAGDRGDDDSSSSTGSSKGDDESPCVWTPQAIALDGDTPYGTATALLAELAGSYSAAFEWQEVSDLDFPHEGESTEVQVEVSVDAIAAREVLAEPTQPYFECMGWLEVDVTMDFATTDGAFAESWPVTMFTSDGSTAGVELHLESTPIAGSFRVDDIVPTTDLELRGVLLQMSIANEHTDGTLWWEAHAMLPTGEDAFGSGPLAEWGDPDNGV